MPEQSEGNRTLVSGGRAVKQKAVCFKFKKIHKKKLQKKSTLHEFLPIKNCMILSAEKVKCSKKIFSLFLLAFFSLSLFAESYRHEVKKGETYYGISRAYGISVDELLKANSLKKDDVLKVGQFLIIPGKEASSPSSSAEKTSSASASSTGSGSSSKSASSSGASLKEEDLKYDTYIVQKGDTLWRIANTNGLKVDELKAMNGMSGDASLKIGQKLKVPAKEKESEKEILITDLTASDPRKYSEKTGDSSLTWPVKNPTVTYTKGKVSGVQLSAKKNENVTCIRSGKVMYVGNYRGYGQVVFIQANTDHVYAYTGLGTIKVKKGDSVSFGDVIGTAGTDSIKGTSQISLMVFQKSNPIDPAKAPRG